MSAPTKDIFFAKLAELVALAMDFPPAAFDEAAPEETTKHKLLRPLLQSLGYEDANIVPEFKILGDQVDYLLKSGHPLLFVEAKSLIDVSLDLFEGHREQVLRYLRNYRVSPEQTQMERPVTWLVVTNFKQWHFIRVTEEKPSFSFKLDDLLPQREKFWDLLARENVEAGVIDKLYEQSHTADLDQRFLADLKRWRLILANGFALQNQTRSLEDITLASQQLLDRFIFSRMLETHRLIEWNKLARSYSFYETFHGDFTETSFAQFLRESLFQEIKFKFNTELFEQPLLCDGLKIDNAALATLIGHEPLHAELAAQCGIAIGQGEMFPFRHLYLYDFSKMSQDVMGAVYERFLAHKLLQSGGRIVIEDTDDLRKKEGIYYTPEYIADYIVGHTLGEKIKPILAEAVTLLGCKNYKGAAAKILELQKIKVLDPAMGSGSFLLRAFDQLVEAYEEYNRACRKAKAERGNGSGMLFDADTGIAEEMDHLGIRVASQNIFGVDLDAQAIEVAKLNLWMRLMIVERDFIRGELRKRGKGSRPFNFLPDLRKNLRRGNSLLADAAVAGATAFVWEKEFPETMKRGGFDVVVGNPPYERIQTMQAYAPESVEFLKANYRSAASGNFDIYVCFIEHGLQLLNAGGMFGYICPHKFFQAEYGEPVRKLLSDGQHVRHVLSFGDLQIFSQVSTYTCLLFLGKEPSPTIQFSQAADVGAFAERREIGKSFPVKASSLSAGEWIFTSEKTSGWMRKAEAAGKPLGEVAKEVFVGLQTSADDVFLFEAAPVSKGVCTVMSESLGKQVKLEAKLLKPVVRSGEIGRFWAKPTHLVLFPYALRDGEAELLSETELAKEFPLAWDYLQKNKARLAARESGKFADKGWWQLYPKNLEFWESPKILAHLLAPNQTRPRGLIRRQ